jgi:hypothetical protein
MLSVFVGLALGVLLLGWPLSCTPRRTKQPPSTAFTPRYTCAVYRGPIDVQDTYCGLCGRFSVQEVDYWPSRLIIDRRAGRR